MQRAPSAGTRGLGTGRAARPARVRAPEESVLISPDPLTSTQDTQREGVVRTPRARRLGLGTVPLPQGDSGDWERPGPSNVSAASVSAVISGGPGGRGDGERGWAGGWQWRLRRGGRVSSPALRPNSAGGGRCAAGPGSLPPPPAPEFPLCALFPHPGAGLAFPGSWGSAPGCWSVKPTPGES